FSGRMTAFQAVDGSSILPVRTIEKIASLKGSPRFARRLICIGFSGQKQIGDFERRKEKFLIKKFKSYDFG
ncbi:MAG: hypothetical protein AAB564_00870, partial [Patescibacteria group bacterium]